LPSSKKASGYEAAVSPLFARQTISSTMASSSSTTTTRGRSIFTEWSKDMSEQNFWKTPCVRLCPTGKLNSRGEWQDLEGGVVGGVAHPYDPYIESEEEIDLVSAREILKQQKVVKKAFKLPPGHQGALPAEKLQIRYHEKLNYWFLKFSNLDALPGAEIFGLLLFNYKGFKNGRGLGPPKSFPENPPIFCLRTYTGIFTGTTGTKEICLPGLTGGGLDTKKVNFLWNEAWKIDSIGGLGKGEQTINKSKTSVIKRVGDSTIQIKKLDPKFKNRPATSVPIMRGSIVPLLQTLLYYFNNNLWLNLANTHGHQDGVVKIPREDDILACTDEAKKNRMERKRAKVLEEIRRYAQNSKDFNRTHLLPLTQLFGEENGGARRNKLKFEGAAGATRTPRKTKAARGRRNVPTRTIASTPDDTALSTVKKCTVKPVVSRKKRKFGRLHCRDMEVFFNGAWYVPKRVVHGIGGAKTTVYWDQGTHTVYRNGEFKERPRVQMEL